MKRVLALFLVAVFVLSVFAGDLARAAETTVDKEVVGNRGYISGYPSDMPESKRIPEKKPIPERKRKQLPFFDKEIVLEGGLLPILFGGPERKIVLFKQPKTEEEKSVAEKAADAVTEVGDKVKAETK